MECGSQCEGLYIRTGYAFTQGIPDTCSTPFGTMPAADEFSCEIEMQEVIIGLVTSQGDEQSLRDGVVMSRSTLALELTGTYVPMSKTVEFVLPNVSDIGVGDYWVTTSLNRQQYTEAALQLNIYDPTRPPTLISMTPSSGSIAGGIVAVIMGENFALIGTACRAFNERTDEYIPMVTTFISAVEVRCVIPTLEIDNDPATPILLLSVVVQVTNSEPDPTYFIDQGWQEGDCTGTALDPCDESTVNPLYLGSPDGLLWSAGKIYTYSTTSARDTVADGIGIDPSGRIVAGTMATFMIYARNVGPDVKVNERQNQPMGGDTFYVTIVPRCDEQYRHYGEPLTQVCREYAPYRTSGTIGILPRDESQATTFPTSVVDMDLITYEGCFEPPCGGEPNGGTRTYHPPDISIIPYNHDAIERTIDVAYESSIMYINNKCEYPEESPNGATFD